MSLINRLHFKTCLFMEASQDIQSIRTEVFQREQGIAAELDFDGLDEQCVHLLAQNNGATIGAARLREIDGGQVIKLERLAILESYRSQGLGSELVSVAMAYAKEQGYQQIRLHAQLPSEQFYRRLGFASSGETFEEAAIKHIKMEQNLSVDLDAAPPKPQ